MEAGRGRRSATVLEGNPDDVRARTSRWRATSASMTATADAIARARSGALERFPAVTSMHVPVGRRCSSRPAASPKRSRCSAQVIEEDSEHAAALNYLGYMLAERGERLSESVALIERAIEMDPHNGSYLDSLGWAYFKLDRLDLAEAPLRAAGDQLQSNSVVQDHLGDLLHPSRPQSTRRSRRGNAR